MLPSSKLPTAVNCCCVPAAMDCVAGVTVIDVSCAGTTVKLEVSDSEPSVAVMLVCPAATVVTKPEFETVATDVVVELQVTALERSALEPSL